MKITFILLAILFALSRVDLASAGSFDCVQPLTSSEREKLLGEVEAHYRGMNDLQADFTQLSYFIGLDERKTSGGQVFFKKPGMMDWVYLEPEKQRFVADGKTLWFSQPDLNQVTLGDFSASFSSDLPVAFLLGVGNLRENFRLESACRSEDGLVARLKPKNTDASLDEFYLLVDEKTRAPKGSRILDVGGNETSIVFQKVILNKGLPESRFRFEIPRGVDVIDNRKLVKRAPVNAAPGDLSETEE